MQCDSALAKFTGVPSGGAVISSPRVVLPEGDYRGTDVPAGGSPAKISAYTSQHAGVF
jgi:hypothetical protein